jgi:hypothetical protein
MQFRFALAWSLALFATIAGCATLKTGLKSAPAPTETYVVRSPGNLLGSGVRTETWHENLTIQGVLDESGMASRHRDFDIDILRRSNTGPGMVKMPIQFDPAKNRVKYETDYAIYPNDEIVIRPKAHNPLDDIARSLSGGN